MSNTCCTPYSFPQPQAKSSGRSLVPLNLRLKQHQPYGKLRRCQKSNEQDPETGLYYYGARYLDPRTSRWLSTDPAMGDYVPQSPINDEAKKHNENLPGMGGVFNYVNLHVYHYAGNNPVKLVDPDGKEVYIAYNQIHSYRTHGVKLPKMPQYHATIVITDDNGNVTHYIESGPKNGKNTKITDNSYSNDRFYSKGLTPSIQDGEWQKQFDGPVTEINPSSMDLKKFGRFRLNGGRKEV